MAYDPYNQHVIMNPILKLSNGEKHYCRETLDKCRECKLDVYYYKMDDKFCVLCSGCGNGTEYFDSVMEAMVEWNLEQRGIIKGITETDINLN